MHLMSHVIFSILVPLKTSLPNEATEEGIEICVNNEYLLNTGFPIEFTEDEIVIIVNDKQSMNALFSIEVTEE